MIEDIPQVLARQSFVAQERVRLLNQKPVAGGDFVLYWMQQSQRAEENEALAYAVEAANHLKVPVLVVFALMDDYPEANLRHYTFMLEGLRETQRTLRSRGIQLAVVPGAPHAVVPALAAEARLLVCDRGYLRHQKQWRREIAAAVACAAVQVEADVVVPLEEASGRAEYAARTLRPKLSRQLPKFMELPAPVEAKKSSLDIPVQQLSLDHLEKALGSLRIQATPGGVSRFFRGGTSEAKKRFDQFLTEFFPRYAAVRNQPQVEGVSHMSPYLHFGQISPVWLAHMAAQAPGATEESRESFLDELIVRRELAMNFVEYTAEYDTYDALPRWARETLQAHGQDTREPCYSLEELERAQTHDPYWNAAMREMVHTGYMHNYLRMYWGKKVLEWSPSPEEAYTRLLSLNNKYFLDGRDANSYANVGWIFGLHDRPWFNRTIFGTVRYMAASGLERKCDIRGYVERVEQLLAR